jgi:hypothetical protein
MTRIEHIEYIETGEVPSYFLMETMLNPFLKRKV